MATVERTPNAGKTYYNDFASGMSLADVAAKYGRGAQSVKTGALNYALSNRLSISVIPAGKPGRVAGVISDEVLTAVRTNTEATIDELVEMTGVSKSVVMRARTQLGLVQHRDAGVSGQTLYEAAVAAGEDVDWAAISKANGLNSGRLAALRANRYAKEAGLAELAVPEKGARLPKDLESVRSVFETSTIEEAMAHFNVGRATILRARTDLGIENPRGRKPGSAVQSESTAKALYDARSGGQSWVGAIESTGVGLTMTQARSMVAAYAEKHGLPSVIASR